MLGWQLSLTVPLAVVGLLTLRAGWLGLRGRLGAVVAATGQNALGQAATTGQTAFAAGARVAAVPLLVAGAVAVLGAAAAAAQPTPASVITVTVVALAGALGLCWAARRLAQRAAHAVTRAAGARQASCAGCSLTASCVRRPQDEWTAGQAACLGGEGPAPTGPHRAGP